MQFYEMYIQKNNDEIEKLIHSLPTCFFITTDNDGNVHSGVFNHFLVNNKLYIHLNKFDEQIIDIKKTGKAKFIFYEFLSFIPSYWVDELNAANATSYYRYAECETETKLIETNLDMIEPLESLMGKFQSEGKYEALSLKSEIYKKALQTIVVVEAMPVNWKTKWKLGQNKSMEKRKEIILKLQERNHVNDQKTSDEMLKWVV